MSTLRALLPTALNICAIGVSTLHLRSHMVYNLEEQEARLDEIEGTLRGHIGLIEDSLDRIEGEKDAGKQEALYQKRGREERHSEDLSDVSVAAAVYTDSSDRLRPAEYEANIDARNSADRLLHRASQLSGKWAISAASNEGWRIPGV
ncbi:hypothetical protein BS50DRAFT_630226 [Corynespora cassiicola Philippines]|uniref:Uncharacterized protein n=1 Tax=Corynespora cassiicola Philippines TaxID=1448308 RepID=A0A2T2P3Q0_CORCC|nr:hypothetical protein BS50DRAFT_630226 [Corynespora cassiicola Philippines]